MVMDQLPRLGKRALLCLLLFTCNYVVSVWRGFLFLWLLGMGYVILLWHSLSLPYNYSGIGFQFHTPGTKESNLAKKHLGKKSCFFYQKSQISGIFKKTVLDFKDTPVRL